jgi:GTP cyclohydrolase I
MNHPELERVRKTTRLVDWLESQITSDPRALRWFDSPEAETRIARAFKELLAGYAVDPRTILKTTRKLGADEAPGVVRIDDISFYSLCAHHFLPFFGRVNVTYVPGDRILGLGKFPRLVQAFARRFTIQEDLVRDVAREIMSSGHARGVRVAATGRHLCMCSRGPLDDNVVTRTEIAMGCLQDKPEP